MNKLRALTFLAAVFVFAAAPARADLRLDINRGSVQPMPIAVSPFYGAQGQDGQIGRDVTSVISANLERSGLFKPLDPKAFIQTPEALHSQPPRFPDWRAINAQALVHGDVEVQPDGRLKIQFRLWDVYGEAQMEGRVYTTALQNWRRVAHIISDAIYKRITGEDGYFDTQVVYISESGPLQRRIKRLAIMDQDSANHRFLTDGRNLVLTPRFSPTAREITYLAYVNNRPRVYLYNVDTGQQEVLGDFPGMTFAPRFSPDGNRVIMSMSQNGNSDIYSMDLRTHRVQRLTEDPAIDTSPCYSPDGSQICFESDRGGRPQIYVMPAAGGTAQRISFAKDDVNASYSTPVWSPRGDYIAFTRQGGGQFSIGIIKPDGTGERLLTSGFHNEGPTFAPNGRVLMFFRDPGGNSGPSLFTIDITGRNELKQPTPGYASDPAWSPLLS